MDGVYRRCAGYFFFRCAKQSVVACVLTRRREGYGQKGGGDLRHMTRACERLAGGAERGVERGVA